MKIPALLKDISGAVLETGWGHPSRERAAAHFGLVAHLTVLPGRISVRSRRITLCVIRLASDVSRARARQAASIESMQLFARLSARPGIQRIRHKDCGPALGMLASFGFQLDHGALDATG